MAVFLFSSLSILERRSSLPGVTRSVSFLKMDKNKVHSLMLPITVITLIPCMLISITDTLSWCFTCCESPRIQDLYLVLSSNAMDL